MPHAGTVASAQRPAPSQPPHPVTLQPLPGPVCRLYCASPPCLTSRPDGARRAPDRPSVPLPPRVPLHPRHERCRPSSRPFPRRQLWLVSRPGSPTGISGSVCPFWLRVLPGGVSRAPCSPSQVAGATPAPHPPRYRASRAAVQTLAVQQACPLSSRLSPENLWQPRWSAGKVGLPCFASFKVRQQPPVFPRLRTSSLHQLGPLHSPGLCCPLPPGCPSGTGCCLGLCPGV